MKKITITVNDIDWDTDGDNSVELPKNMSFTATYEDLDINAEYNIQDDCEDVIGEYVSDKISDETGFCHNGFSTTIA